jgi:type VI secretion system secreted protein VgrG
MADESTDRIRLPILGATLTTPLGPGLDLMAFHAEEFMSGLFHCSLEMLSSDDSVDLGSMVGESVTVAFDLPDGSQRYFNGIVSRFMQGGQTIFDSRSEPLQCSYFAELRPWLWLLGKGSDCRIFQNMTVPAIVSEVFSALGQSDFLDSTTRTYPQREYCVQYNETHLDFVCRLLEEEGIFYYFTHSDGAHTLVLADAPSEIQACSGAAELTYEESAEVDDVNIVYRASVVESVVAGKHVHDDFNFETPSTDLEVETPGTHGTQQDRRAIFEYPGGFSNTGDGTTIGRFRIEQLETRQKVLKGQSLTPALYPGGKFSLSNHFRTDLNAEYAIIRISHLASSGNYSNSFDAIPADVPFRPARTASKPRIPGAQTAIVVGPSGEEIHTDQYARVKVQFHWDRVGAFDDKSSCWVRVAQGWAGKGWGQIFIPRIGQEVVVAFEEGDPDRPLITGSVYNAEQVVPYTMPDDQTKSGLMTRSTLEGETTNFNELRFEDKKGEEQIYIHAEKDFERVVENNDTLKVGFEGKDKGDQTIDILNDRTVTLEEGNDLLQLKKGNRDVILDEGNDTITLKKGNRDVILDKGDHTLKVALGKRTVDVFGDDSLTIETGNHTVSVSAGKSSTEALQSIELKVGGSSLTIDMGGITLKGPMIKLEGDGMIDLKAPATFVKGDGVLKLEAGGLLMLKGAILKIG